MLADIFEAKSGLVNDAASSLSSMFLFVARNEDEGITIVNPALRL